MTKNIFLLSILTISTLTQAQATPDKPVLDAVVALRTELSNISTTVKTNEQNAQAERKAMQGVLDKSLKLIKKGGRGGRFVAIALGAIVGGTTVYGYEHSDQYIEIAKKELRKLVETTTKANSDEASTDAEEEEATDEDNDQDSE